MNRPSNLPWRFPRELPSPVPPHPLDRLLSPDRARLYRQVLARRTGRIAVVVEDCYDPHNATAVARTCDAFGISRLDVVTQENDFRINRRVSQGAHRYVDLRVHGDIEAAYASLRADGHRILVSDLDAAGARTPRELRGDLAGGPVALVFGRESSGLSPAGRAGADGAFLIPMLGFTRSLNVSVSVAVTLYALREKALEEDHAGDLDPETQRALFETWVRRHNERGAEALDSRGSASDSDDGECPADLDVYSA